MHGYFDNLEGKLDEAYEVAKKARSEGYDPEEEPEIPLAEDLAERVEKLAGPEGVAEAIRSLEEDYSREDLAFKVAEMIVNDEFGHMPDDEAAEQAIRTTLAIITEGTAAAAPIEGITHVDIKKNFDGSPYLAIYFAGPIRSAGGTAAALAVLTGDFIRRKLNLSTYDPSDREVERAVEEVSIYDASVGLQYSPSEDEVRRAYSNIPIEISGEPTEQETVTANRDLERVETNRVRGGAVLTIAEGVLSKAPKILKHLKNLDLSGWDWLRDLRESTSEDESEGEYPKGDKYLNDIIAGRGVFGHPARPGGFRLRYGRARNTGLAAAGIHPATMRVLDDHVSAGTQLKTERPGKATAAAPVDTLEGPTVKLDDGSVVYVDSSSRARELRDRIDEIISIGDILFGYGEFLENNHPLMPSAYCEEWWAQEVKKAIEDGEDFEEDLSQYLEPPYRRPSPEGAVDISQRLGVPLHPAYTYPYHDLELEDIENLGEWLASGEPSFRNGVLEELRLDLDEGPKRILEVLGIPHEVEEEIVLIKEEAFPLCECLNLIDSDSLHFNSLEAVIRENNDKEVTEVVGISAGFPIRKKAPTRIGTRMGRPEKTKPRKMKPPPHVLFPIGWAGGSTRNITKASERNVVEVEVAFCKCPECDEVTILRKCPSCGARTEIVRYCPNCERPTENEECMACGTRTILYKEREVELKSLLNDSLGNLQETLPDTLKGVVGMTSSYKLPEPLEKGILRAKHEIYVFKDGTIRFDATDLPLTHFTPREVKVSVERLKELGYEEDYKGEPLESEDQILELKVQDILLPKPAAEYLLRVAQYVDDLLQKFYNQPPFYNASEREDLLGHLVIGLAPHTSAGITGRIIGFTDARAGYAHPYFHAAKRRNCFDYSQRVFLYDGNNRRFITKKIGELVEEGFQKTNPVNIDSYGTEKVDVDNDLYAYVLDRDTGKIIKKPVKCFIRGNTEEWVKITTSTNRELKVTPDHNLSVMDNGRLKVKEAAEIKEGDRVPISIKTPVESQICTINVAKELCEIDGEKLHQIRIRNASKFFKKLVRKLGKEKIFQICGGRENFPKNLFDWYKSVPLLHFKKICEETKTDYNDLPKHVEIGIRRDRVTLPVYIEDTSSLFWLLGIYCAEGWSRSTDSSHHVSFRVGEREIRKKIERIMRNIFGLKPYEREDKLTYSSKALKFLISEAWDAGSTAYEKKVPEIVYHGMDEDVKEFLSAYFDGDGSISLSPDRIAFYSTSKKLLEGVSNLLLRAGIFSRYHKTKERGPGRKVRERYKELNTEPATHRLYHLILTGEDKYRFASYIHSTSQKKMNRAAEMASVNHNNARRLINYKGKNYEAVPSSDYTFDIVKKVNKMKVDDERTYCLDVEGEELLDKNVLWHNQLIQLRCDGDEDAVMLLLDALLNFSRYYLPETRGGRMDAPLVLTPRLDPSEIDDEAHNLDVDSSYPLEFYEATLNFEDPSSFSGEVEVVGDRLGTEDQYENIGFSEAHNPTSVSAGPSECRYKSLGPMDEKTESQLSLARRLRSVDESDVVERLIENHFIPDLRGNLRAFSRQKFRCASCNTKYRRIPLTGECENCGSDLILTVTRGGVEKYMQVAIKVAEDYGATDYTKQRLKLVEEEIFSLFESDIKEQLSLADFA